MTALFRMLLVCLACLIALPALAASDRVALVIGMADYRHIEPLKNTRNDAEDLARTLEGIGFDVTLSQDATGAELRQTLDDFAFRSETADLALIYFAGHGVQVQGENYLIPVDADVKSNDDVQRQSLSLDTLMQAVDRARKMRIVILDSCRDNPLGGVAGLSQTSVSTGDASDGLAAANPDRGTLVAYAAKEGVVALDGEGRNSPFAKALMEKMVVPGLEISLMFRQVRDMVLRETGNYQEPHTYGSLTGIPFYLAGPPDGQSAPGLEDVVAAWSSVPLEYEDQIVALAETGDTRSLLALANMRLNPKEERYDPKKAIEFLERAAEAGSPEAQHRLARILEDGVIIERDEQRALALYQAAAEQDYPKSVNNLGFAYYYGNLGLERDISEALRHFERAADLRNPEAMFNFAALIDDGHIEGKGPADAAAYLYSALRVGAEDALKLLSERPTMFKTQTRRALQGKLKEFGFYEGAIDGQFGPGTNKAMRRAFGLED